MKKSWLHVNRCCFNLYIIADNPVEIKKEVIVVPVKPVIIIKEPVVKPTTIILDKNGVKVETKKADIIVKKQNRLLFPFY